MVKKILSILLSAVLLASFSACSGPQKDPNQVVIYSCAEEFRNEHILKRLREEFPDYNINLQYISTGKCAAKLKSEGKSTEADIVIALEESHIVAIEDSLADLSEYDTSDYLPELVPQSRKYLPWERFSGAVVINPETLKKHNLPVPQSYDDLLKPEYKGYIFAPNPKLSSTGYIFLIQMINERGEEAAYDYFDKLATNTIQFTSSGSGPVNALVQGEAAVGLGMIFQSVQEINKGVPIEILDLPGGTPYSISGLAAIDGRLENPKVKDVFDFLADTLVYEDKEFSPEQIFKDQQINVENYPQNLDYANMKGLNDAKLKERLMETWMS